jgi:hypothetical protein
MAPLAASRKRSLADMQNTDVQPQPSEYNDRDYIREVLQLDEGRTETSFDEELAKEAESLGIVVEKPEPTEGKENAHHSMCESAITVASHHARTASSGSQGSNSTGMTSRSSLDTAMPATRKRSTAHRKSLSFGEYEKFLTQAEEDRKQENMAYSPPPIPPEPAPSLFSVSTRRSYVSIRNGIRNRFRLRRRNSSKEELKYVLVSSLFFLHTTKWTASAAAAPGGPAERHSLLSSFFIGAGPKPPGLAALEKHLEKRFIIEVTKS